MVWVALIDWIDGDVEDTDEFVVQARSAKEAERMARAIWVAKFRMTYPRCRITNIFCRPPHDVGVS
jgi:hypothetical protein